MHIYPIFTQATQFTFNKYLNTFIAHIFVYIFYKNAFIKRIKIRLLNVNMSHIKKAFQSNKKKVK